MHSNLFNGPDPSTFWALLYRYATLQRYDSLGIDPISFGVIDPCRLICGRLFDKKNGVVTRRPQAHAPPPHSSC
jgi:hypothetical protein